MATARRAGEPAGAFVGIGIDGSHDAGACQNRGGVGNCVVGFVFVSPTVNENGRARAVRRNFRGHFVAFQRVLQSADFEPEFVG